MKIFFINPPFKSEYGKFSRENRSPAITRSGALYYPLWLIYAASVCEKEGFAIAFLDAPAKPMTQEESLQFVERNGLGTKLIVINTSTPSIYNDIAFGAAVKRKYPEAKMILVGTHPSALPEETLNIDSHIDAVARHEYDYIVRDLAIAIRDRKDLSTVKGLTFRAEDGKVVSNPDMPFITKLDDIPFAAQFIKSHLNHKDYFFAPAAYPEIQIFTGRGCMARCNFCVYPQTMHGHTYRLRSPENVVDEFQYIADHFPDVKEVVIEDDTFTAKKERVKEICRLFVERGLHKKLRWLCNARVHLDYETMKQMKQAGCHLIIPGIESSSQKILNNIKKGTTIEQVRTYIKNAKKAKLMVHACYMVGNNGETKESMQDTLRLALELNTDTAQFYPLLPFPGTEAYQWAKENGYINGSYEDYVKEDGTINSLLNLPELSSEEMVRFCDDARRKYYLRPGYILHRIWMGLRDPQDFKRALKAFVRIKKYLFSGT